MSKFGAAQGADFPADPTASDDARGGFHVGFKWRNSISGAVFRCNDHKPNAAVWQNISTGVDTSLTALVTSLEGRVTALETGGGGGGTGTVPYAPIISISSPGNDNTPNFAVDLPFGNGAPHDVVAGDVLRIRNVTSGTDIVVHTITSGEIAGAPMTISGVTPVSDGLKTFEARLERSGSATAWSPTVSITIDTTAPTITSASSTNIDENLQLAFSLTANETSTWSITGGADASKFEISGNTLRWFANDAKDFEAPDDANSDNVYVVQVTATDTAANTTNQTISVTVNNVADTGLRYTPFGVLGGDVGGFTNTHTFTGVSIGAPSADRLVIAAVVTDGAGGTQTLTVVDGANSYPLTADPTNGIFYGSVPTGVSVNFVYSNTNNVRNFQLALGTLKGQVGGASATPAHSDGSWVQSPGWMNDPLSMTITVPTGGIAALFANGGNGGTVVPATFTWSGAASSSGDGYEQSTTGNTPQLAANHATASGTVTATCTASLSGGALYYLSFA